MRGSAKLVQDLRCDELVFMEVRPAVHDTMAYGDQSRVNIVPDFRGESREGVALRFMDTFAGNQRASIGRMNV